MSLESVHVALDDFHNAAKNLFEELHNEISDVVNQLRSDFQLLQNETPTTPAVETQTGDVLPPPTVVPPTVSDPVSTGDSATGESNVPTEGEGPQSGPENSITTETDNSHA